jgi:hypothetical protein
MTWREDVLTAKPRAGREEGGRGMRPASPSGNASRLLVLASVRSAVRSGGAAAATRPSQIPWHPGVSAALHRQATPSAFGLGGQFGAVREVGARLRTNRMTAEG